MTLSTEELLELDLRAEGNDWVPTPHGHFMAEMLAEHEDLVRGKEVLELGGGVGNHTIILLKRGARRVVTTEITRPRSATTRSNVRRYCPEAVVEYRVADWLDTEGTFDLIVANPPFAKSGKRNRRYFIDALILDAHKRLRPGGELIFVQSSMANLPKTKRRLVENGYAAAVLGSSQGPFRDYYYEDATFMEEIRDVPDGFEIRDGEHHETLHVLHARLEPWTPPSGAHIVDDEEDER